MNPYLPLARQFGGEDVRLFLLELTAWHDEMVQHRRLVSQVGAEQACSDTCPHQTGRQLWREARALLGAKADSLTFLRDSARESAREERGPDPVRAGGPAVAAAP